MTKSDEGFDWPNGKHEVFKSRPDAQSEEQPEDAQGKRLDEEAEPFFECLHEAWMDSCSRTGWYFAVRILGSALASDEDTFRTLTGDQIAPTKSGIHLPLLYCCRHFIEVSLKHLVEGLQPLSKLEPKVTLDREHSLMPLWNEANRQWIAVFTDEKDDDTARQVERPVNQFNEYDPRSVAFRYRYDKQGQPHEIPKFSTEEIMQTMLALRNCFDGMADAIWHVKDNMNGH